jgi:protein-disulfide isomerase
MKALLLVAAALLVAPSNGSAQTSGAPSKRPAAPPSEDTVAINALLERADAGRIQGAKTASVWIVEISDFQCPFCKRWHDEIYPAIQREFITPGHVRMAYVNLPLSMHQHAVPAALTAMCAAAQDKFWPVHDKLFKTQERWATMTNVNAIFDSLALAGGVDAATWRNCMRSGVMQRVINGDRARAAATGVRSTPTFFVGSEMIEGVAPLTEFRAAIQRARAKARSVTP